MIRRVEWSPFSTCLSWVDSVHFVILSSVDCKFCRKYVDAIRILILISTGIRILIEEESPESDDIKVTNYEGIQRRARVVVVSGKVA